MGEPDDRTRTRWAGPSAVYDDDGRAASALVYHVVLVTRRQRPLFGDRAVAARVEELLGEAARGAGCELVGCAVEPSWVRLEVRAPPTVSPHVVVTRLRRDTAGPLKREVEAARRQGAVFVRRYLISTESVSDPDCAAFVGRVSKA